MPKKSHKSEKFIHFLSRESKGKKMSFQDYILTRAEVMMHKQQYKRAEKEKVRLALSQLIDKHLPPEKPADPDEESSYLWIRDLEKKTKELITELESGLRRPKKKNIGRFLFQEIRIPKRWEKHFWPGFADDEHQPLDFGFSAKLATAAFIALMISVGLSQARPEAAERLARTTDKLVMGPILGIARAVGIDTTVRIAGSTAPREPAKSLPVDQNILSSYIVNNQNQIRLSDSRVIPVRRRELDGRVAGAYEAAPAEPSSELLLLSKSGSKSANNRGWKEKIGRTIEKLVEKQLELSAKLQKTIQNIIE